MPRRNKNKPSTYSSHFDSKRLFKELKKEQQAKVKKVESSKSGN